MRLPLMIAALLIATAVTAAPAPLVVVELFQSQGCSSCPPANANVNALIDTRSDVLALSFAVNYWDQLGWKDSFATPAYTQRQWDYAKGLRHDQVWTPQVIVGGAADTVGNRAADINALIAASRVPAGAPTLALGADGVSIGAGTAPRTGAAVWLVRYDPRTVQVAVKAGENGGRTLPHRNIVRALVRLGDWHGAPAHFALPPAPAGLATAVLVQPLGGPILAAARG
jgi:hypothetical protein